MISSSYCFMIKCRIFFIIWDMSLYVVWDVTYDLDTFRVLIARNTQNSAESVKIDILKIFEISTWDRFFGLKFGQPIKNWSINTTSGQYGPIMGQNRIVGCFDGLWGGLLRKTTVFYQCCRLVTLLDKFHHLMPTRDFCLIEGRTSTKQVKKRPLGGILSNDHKKLSDRG